MAINTDDLHILQDGTHVNPADCSDVKGEMRHKNGLKVLMRADGKPQTVGQAAIDNMNVFAASVGKPAGDESTDAPLVTMETLVPVPPAPPPRPMAPAAEASGHAPIRHPTE